MGISDHYVTSFTAKRMVWSVDGQGNDQSALEDIASFSGHIQQTGPELAQNMGLQFSKTFTIFCSTNTDVAEGDQLVSGGFTYTVKAKQEYLNGRNAHLELVCQREPYHP